MTLLILIIVLVSILAVPLSLKKLIDQSKASRSDVLPGFDMSGEGEHRVILKSVAGYGIEIDESIPEGSGRIIIAMHGFCGSKASRCITLLQRIETGKGIGLVKFDWPAHGRSKAKDADLTIANCLRDLDVVVQHVRRRSPDAELVAFATSFGGYIAMLYAADHPQTFSQIILRSPALRFGWLLREKLIDEDMQRQLRESGYFTTGFERKINVSQEFVTDAEDHRLEDIYGGFDSTNPATEDGDVSAFPADTGRHDPLGSEQIDAASEILSRVTIIHGDADELVPYGDSVAFAQKHGIELYTVIGADHRYTGQGLLEEAVAFASGKIGQKEMTT